MGYFAPSASMFKYYLSIPSAVPSSHVPCVGRSAVRSLVG